MSDTRLYVASLSDYNNGHLHGVWIDLDADTEREGLDKAIKAMLLSSMHPNTMVAALECGMCGAIAVEEHAPDWECEACGSSLHIVRQLRSAEEWAVHDYDGIPATFGEHPDLDDLLEFVKGVEEHGDAFRAFVQDRGVTNFIHEDFQDKYAGEADSAQAWIDEHLKETGVLDEVPEQLRSYFDSESYLRDMKLGGDVSFEEYDGTTYAFWS